jgi:hypothetical protein
LLNLLSKMDPLSALSLAGTVIQFVDFSSKLISTTRELQSTCELDVHTQAAVAANDVLDYSTKLRQPLSLARVSRRLTEDEAALDALCLGCIELADSFLKRLNKLKIPEEDRRYTWPSLRVALRSMWKTRELVDIEGKLTRYRREIDSRVLHSLRQV